MPTLHIFGGGTELLANAVDIAAQLGWRAAVRTSPRLWEADSEIARRIAMHRTPVYIGTTLDEVLTAGPDVRQGDVALSLGAPWLFSRAQLDQWAGRAYNYHPRRLPENRGGGGSSWPIMMRESTGMAAFHQMTEELDAGPVVASREVSFSSSARTPRDHDAETEAVAATLMDEWLRSVLSRDGHTSNHADQDSERATYWPRLHTPTHGWVDWQWPAADIVSFVAAFSDPYPGARTFLRNTVVVVRSAVVLEPRAFHPFQAGLVCRIGQEQLCVAARDASLGLHLEPDGCAARLGDRLFTPRWILDRALATRVSIRPDGTVRSEFAGPVLPVQER